MGHVFVIGFCYHCKKKFSFNPNFVPSLTINGDRKPFCKVCIDRANTIRIEKGMKPLEVHLEAYKPLDEKELL